jgi:hypothetical protein
VPKTQQTCFKGVFGNFLKVSVAAAPEKNQANQELVSFLAKFFSLPKSRVVIESGLTSRNKQVLLVDVRREIVEKALKDF